MATREEKRVSHSGIWGWRPSCLQTFNNPSMFLFFFSLTGFATSIPVGMNQVLMPALQQLFNMTSTQMGLILISNDISGFIVAFVFGHFSSRGKIRWIFSGVIVLIISFLMQSGAQLLVKLPETEVPQNGSTAGSASMCSDRDADGYSMGGNSPTSNFYAAQNNSLFWILFVAGMLHGVGNTPLMVCGLTYLDEIMTQKKLGPAIAVNNILNFLAFPVSFVLGAFFIQQYVTLGEPPEGLTPESSHWVGAWWMGYLVPAVLLVVAGFPLLLFPTQMPAAKAVLQKKIMRGDSTEEEKEAELNRSFRELMRDMYPTIKRLAKNNVLVFMLFGEAFSNIFLSSMPYDTKLYSLLYKIPIAKTGTLLGILRTVATVIGLGIGGTIVGKFKLSGKKCILFTFLVHLLTLPITLLTLWHCTPDVVVGIDSPYQGDMLLPQRNLTSLCNENCSCSTRFYEPTCDIDEKITYFSPCYAGCRTSSKSEKDNAEVYLDCSCSTNTLKAGPCPKDSECSTKMWIVLIAQNLIGIIIFISAFPAMNIAYLRIVNEIDRSATQGAKQFFTRAFGFLLGPIIFGAIIDSYCSMWRGEGDEMGSCLLYDLDKLILTFSLCQTGFRLFCTISFFMAYILSPDIPKYSEKLPDCDPDSDGNI